jgi:hypothetical protein
MKSTVRQLQKGRVYHYSKGGYDFIFELVSITHDNIPIKGDSHLIYNILKNNSTGACLGGSNKACCLRNKKPSPFNTYCGDSNFTVISDISDEDIKVAKRLYNQMSKLEKYA